MAEHGYARDYDEPIDRSEEEQERWRDPQHRAAARTGSDEWSDRNRGVNERNVNFMLGDRERSWESRRDRGQGRGYHSSQEGARSSRAGEYRPYRSGYGEDWDRGDRDMGNHGLGNDWDRSPRNYSSHQDDHYRSWRDRQMEALDRDYADYCREREQQFHRDFDDWRQNRGQQTSQGSRAGSSSEEVMELNNPADLTTEPQSISSPTAEATLGTNNTENSGVGRS